MVLNFVPNVTLSMMHNTSSEDIGNIINNNNVKKNGKKNKVRLFKNKKKNSMRQHDNISLLQEAYERINISSVKLFKDLPLSEPTLKGLNACNYKELTDIQRESIGLSLRGCDILGAAKTGSGKTLAFLVPLLERLYIKQWDRYAGIGALVITPTRELAYQIFETLKLVGTHHDFSAALLIGGKDLKFEKTRIHKCNILICTPGRLLQHMEENPQFDCSNIQILVLDEADRILDLGFQTTVDSILENLPATRQTLLFSATQTKSVRDLARLSLQDPMYVSVHEHARHSTPEGLQQSYVVCALEEKLSVLWSFIKMHLKQKVLVFMATCKQVKYHYDMFCRLRPGTTLLALYGSLHQLRRMAIYESFCRKSNAVLFATDIAARGLDFPAVDWVVQLDCPEDAHTYIHRVGRTARYQLGGESLLVLLPSEEQGMVEQMSDTKIPITKIKINPNKLQNPVRKMEALLARDPNLKASAQRAFVTYAKSVFLMKNKQVFNVGALDTDAYSKSLGLAIPPRIRFLRNLDKRQEQLPVVTDREDSTADSSSEEDILCVKRWDHELTTEPEPEPVSKTSKVVSKAAVVKKILKKKIIANRKTLYDEEGQAVVNKGKDKLSELARQYEMSEEAGLDVVAAKLVLREEDKFDKQLFRDRVKEKHREEKRRLRKAAGREDDDKDEGVVLKGSAISGDDSSNEERSDRDESSNEERDDSSNEERSERDDSSDEEQSKQDYGGNEECSRQDDNKGMEQFHRILPSKRLSTPGTSEAKRRRRDMSLSLGEEEELALRLLGHN